MMNFDIEVFKRKEENEPDDANTIIQFARKVAELNSEMQSSISMLYPTMGM
jgi:hypothetical protein